MKKISDNYLQSKDITIKQIVEHLQNKFGEAQVLIKDHWGEDNFAIGLVDKTEKYLVYISTLGMAEDSYYVSLENPSNNKEYPYTPAGDFQMPKEELEKIVQAHFRL
jgi:GGDEF domain-containing protein